MHPRWKTNVAGIQTVSAQNADVAGMHAAAQIADDEGKGSNASKNYAVATGPGN